MAAIEPKAASQDQPGAADDADDLANAFNRLAVKRKCKVCQEEYVCPMLLRPWLIVHQLERGELSERRDILLRL